MLLAANPFSAAWNGLLDAIAGALAALHDVLVPLFGVHAWGWAIIGLTVVIRVLLLPLALKQTRSMRAMQSLQPRVKEIQRKHKASRDLMRKDPAAYRERRQKMNEEVMALYREEGVNPAAGCLPLILQMPIFFALFRVLSDPTAVLNSASFYIFSPLGEQARADVGGWILIVLMAGTMFYTQRQMQVNNPAAEPAQLQQQKILLYVMPVFLAFIGASLPIGVLVYWVTTNLWQVAQQALILHEVRSEAREAGDQPQPSKGGRASARGEQRDRPPRQRASGDGSPKGAGKGAGAREDHLPRRRGGSRGQRTR